MDIKKRHFFADYQEIEKNHPHDGQKRLELSLYRNALERMMETEYYLTLILNEEERFGRVSSSLAPLPGYPDFYRALRTQSRQWQRHMRQNSAVVRPMLIAALMGLSQQLGRIETELESIEQAFAEQKDEQLKSELIDLASSLLQIKDGFFADWPWAMILYNSIEHEGKTGTLKEHLITLSEEIKNDHDPETSFGRLEKKTRPLLEQASRQTLEHITHAIHRYRTHRQKLLNHNLVREQTMLYLEELEDQKALEALQNSTEKPQEGITAFDTAAVAGAIGICYFGGRLLALPIASIVATNSTLSDLSSKASLREGVTFGLNNLSQYERAHSVSPFFKMVKEFSLVGASIISCAAPQGTSAIKALTAKLQNTTRPGMSGRLKNALSPDNIKWHIRDKVMDINAAPMAVASVSILAGIQAHQYGTHSLLTSPDFHLTALITSVVEFVFVFKSIQSGTQFFSKQHLESMREVSRTIFGLSLGTQALYSIARNESFERNRSFYEATFAPLIGFNIAKTMLLYMAPPFSKFLGKSFLFNPQTSRRLAVFILSLPRSALGNYMYLNGINAVFN